MVLSDPPWKYTHSRPFIQCPYPCMTTGEIAALPVATTFLKTKIPTVLFMWTTDSHLEQALTVIKKWKFKYKTIAFHWVKTRKNRPVKRQGYYSKKSSEIVLLATRGHVTKFIKEKPDQLVYAECGRHSEKPWVIHEAIEKMFPEAEKFEMFARKKKQGWKSWGNEIQNDFTLKEDGQQ